MPGTHSLCGCLTWRLAAPSPPGACLSRRGPSSRLHCGRHTVWRGNLGPETRGSGSQPRRGGSRVESRRSLHAPTHACTRPTLAYANTRVPSRRLTSSHVPSHNRTHTHGSHHTFHARPHACPACQPPLLSESPRNPVLSSLWQGPRLRCPGCHRRAGLLAIRTHVSGQLNSGSPLERRGHPVSQIWVPPSIPEFLETPREPSLASYCR